MDLLIHVRVQNCSNCGGPMAPDVDACSYCRAAVEYDERKLSLICAECFARNSEISNYCRGCGIAFRPQPMEADPVGLKCPCCSIELRRRAVVGYPADECAKCEGLWIHREYFTALVNVAVAAHKKLLDEAPYQPADEKLGPRVRVGKVQYRLCPTCGTVMHRRNFERVSGIIVDECGDHGVWLDADELEGIAAFISSGGLSKAEAYKKRLAHEELAALKSSTAPTGGWMTSIPPDQNSNSTGVFVEAVASTLVDLVEALIRRATK